jgi:hypothetical protein
MQVVVVDFTLSVQSLASSVSRILFPVMPECARTLCMWIVCGVQYIWCIVYAIYNLFGW